MQWNDHLSLKGKHAFLSPSNYHWVNYSDDKLTQVYLNRQKVEEGTRLHAFSAEAIANRIRLANRKKALNCFVNDSISFGMSPEVLLYYSDNCFGTADAIHFDEEDNILFIFDLKTGDNEASMIQLDVYAALFCLEYGFSPKDIDIVERIYQYDGYKEQHPDAEAICDLMDTIIHFDWNIEQLKNSL